MTESTGAASFVQPDDLFSVPVRGGGGAKLEDLEGRLVLFMPTELGRGPKYQSPGETVPRITTDVVVFDDEKDDVEEFSDVYYSQATIVNVLKNALKPGNRPYVLGRIVKFPSKTSQAQGIDTPEKLTAATEAWLKKGGKGDRPGFAWSVAEFSENDAAKARKFIASRDQFANSAS